MYFYHSFCRMCSTVIKVCIVLMAIACFFGDEKTDNRKKLTVIKNNSIDLIVSGGEQIISTITSSKKKKKEVEEFKEIVDDVVQDVGVNQEFNIDLYARYY
ncbi:MAG: hypothetical protein LBE20_03930 [Deltaproteobacteria bacterium]|nr:hypothetical protein [Deltaproteobacteria bacterium]